MSIEQSFDFMNLVDDSDFGDWSFEEDEDNSSFVEEEDFFEEEEPVDYFGDSNKFFCPHCDTEFEQDEAMLECFKRCHELKSEANV